MRDLLRQLLIKYCGFEGKCMGSPANNDVREFADYPFKDVFRAGREKDYKTIFNDRNIANIIINCHCANNIENLIKYLEDNYVIYGEKYIPLVYKNCSELEIINRKAPSCYLNLKGAENYGWNEKCNGCEIKWIYNALKGIERNAHKSKTIYNHSKCKLTTSQKKYINKTYKKIKTIEKMYVPSDASIIQFKKLYKRCLHIKDIPDAQNERLSYVKWYTAHLMTWPPLKAELVINRKYSEWDVFELLNSAVHIQSMFSTINNLELLYTMESERIASFLSLDSNDQSIIKNFYYLTSNYKDILLYKSCSINRAMFLLHYAILLSKLGSYDAAEEIMFDLVEYMENHFNCESRENMIIRASCVLYSSMVNNKPLNTGYTFMTHMCNNVDLWSDTTIAMLLYSFADYETKNSKDNLKIYDNSPVYQNLLRESKNKNRNYINFTEYRANLTFEKPSEYIRILGDRFISTYKWEGEILRCVKEEVED